MADKITSKDLADKKDDFVLIDVREADEVVEDGGGIIEGAVNIPLGQLIRKTRQGGLDDLKGKTICTYCNGGYRGNIGADELNKKGFTAGLSMAAMQLGKRRKRRIRNELYL
jgi:rhodanese-related sulfurtransferase